MTTDELPAIVAMAIRRRDIYAIRRQLSNPRLDPLARCELASRLLTQLFHLDPPPTEKAHAQSYHRQ